MEWAQASCEIREHVDEERQGEEEIQKLTDDYVLKVEQALASKEKDLLDF